MWKWHDIRVKRRALILSVGHPKCTQQWTNTHRQQWTHTHTPWTHTLRQQWTNTHRQQWTHTHMHREHTHSDSSEQTHTHTCTVNTHTQTAVNKHTHTPWTHTRELLWVQCLAQGHLSRGIEGGESAVHSLPPTYNPAGPLGYESDSLTIRPRLPHI